MVWTLAGESARPVTYEHGEIADNLLAGRGFTVKFLGVTGATSQQAPFYPTVLAASYGVFGTGSPRALLAVQVLQALAGTALVLTVVWLGWSLVPHQPTVGWIAGWGAAVYPTHVYMVTHMQVALWAALVLTLLVAVAASPRGRSSWWKAVLAGVLAGFLLLVEPILVIALPIVAVLLAGRPSTRAPRHKPPVNSFACPPPDDGGPSLAQGELVLPYDRNPDFSCFSQCRTASIPELSEACRGAAGLGPLARVATMTACAVLIVAPWLWRNYRVHDEFVFVKSTFGYAFWQGNNSASWGTDKVPKRSAETLRNDHDGTLAGMHQALWEARHETLYIDDVLLAPTGYHEFTGLSEPARSRLLGARAWRFVRDEPARYLGLCVQRLRYFLLFDETNPKAANLVYRAATVVWLTLTLIGSLALRLNWRRLWPTWAIFAVVTAFHTLTIVSARFRIPIEPLSFVWAAGAVAPLVDNLLSDFMFRPNDEARGRGWRHQNSGNLHKVWRL